MDVIKIRDLEIYGHHGVMKEENVLGQKFLVSLALYTDTRAAGESDNLADSVNYAEVSYLVKEHIEISIHDSLLMNKDLVLKKDFAKVSPCKKSGSRD
jgi:dihydroneopterin aldolase